MPYMSFGCGTKSPFSTRHTCKQNTQVSRKQSQRKAWVGLFRLQPDFRIQRSFRKQWKWLWSAFWAWILTFHDTNFNLVPSMEKYNHVLQLCVCVCVTMKAVARTDEHFSLNDNWLYKYLTNKNEQATFWVQSSANFRWGRCFIFNHTPTHPQSLPPPPAPPQHTTSSIIILRITKQAAWVLDADDFTEMCTPVSQPHLTVRSCSTGRGFYLHFEVCIHWTFNLVLFRCPKSGTSHTHNISPKSGTPPPPPTHTHKHLRYPIPFGNPSCFLQGKPAVTASSYYLIHRFRSVEGQPNRRVQQASLTARLGILCPSYDWLTNGHHNFFELHDTNWPKDTVNYLNLVKLIDQWTL